MRWPRTEPVETWWELRDVNGQRVGEPRYVVLERDPLTGTARNTRDVAFPGTAGLAATLTITYVDGTVTVHPLREGGAP